MDLDPNKNTRIRLCGLPGPPNFPWKKQGRAVPTAGNRKKGGLTATMLHRFFFVNIYTRLI